MSTPDETDPAAAFKAQRALVEDALAKSDDSWTDVETYRAGLRQQIEVLKEAEKDAVLTPLDLPRLTDEELKTFIREFLAGRFFTSAHLKDNQANMAQMVFLPIALGAFSDYRKDSLGVIGLIYADMSQALPRSVNGLPIFMSCKLLHRLDWIKAAKVIRREYEKLNELELPPDED